MKADVVGGAGAVQVDCGVAIPSRAQKDCQQAASDNVVFELMNLVPVPEQNVRATK